MSIDRGEGGETMRFEAIKKNRSRGRKWSDECRRRWPSMVEGHPGKVVFFLQEVSRNSKKKSLKTDIKSWEKPENQGRFLSRGQKYSDNSKGWKKVTTEKIKV